MARGIRLDDFVYEIDSSPPAGTAAAVISTILLRMDFYNVGTADDQIKKANATAPAIPGHITMSLNEREFGIHPRYLVCELNLGASATNCFGVNLKRIVHIPVLTLAQFQGFNTFQKGITTQKAKSTLKVNHSFDGKGFATYNIIRKVDQTLI